MVLRSTRATVPRPIITGAWGERLAAEYLANKRYKLVAANYRCRFGELDLVVRNRTYLVFVEVKLRKNAAFAMAREYVDVHKQEKLRTTASLFLSQNPTKLQPRFDVIEIYAPDGIETAHPEIIHLEDAFQ